MKIYLKVALKPSISPFKATPLFLLWRIDMEICELKPTGHLRAELSLNTKTQRNYSCGRSASTRALRVRRAGWARW